MFMVPVEGVCPFRKLPVFWVMTPLLLMLMIPCPLESEFDPLNNSPLFISMVPLLLIAMLPVAMCPFSRVGFWPVNSSRVPPLISMSPPAPFPAGVP